MTVHCYKLLLLLALACNNLKSLVGDNDDNVGNVGKDNNGNNGTGVHCTVIILLAV